MSYIMFVNISIKINITMEEKKVFADIHIYDYKGKYWLLDRIAQEVISMGIEFVTCGQNDESDGYVTVNVTREQARALDKKYKHFNLCYGRGKTFDECFDDALRIEEIYEKTRR